MTETLARREELPARDGLTPSQVDIIRNTICRGASDDELAFFLEVCKRTGLNPFQRQIHAIRRWNNQEKRETMTIQVGIDGFRLIADRTNRYCPGREPEFRYDARGQVEAATAYVKKLVAGEWHEIAATAYFAEYCQRNKDGEANQMWRTMPRAMLAKTAEALALRKAFPAETSGVYSKEEMDQADNPLQPPRTTVTETRPALAASTVDAATGEVVDAAPRIRSPKRGVAEEKMATLILRSYELGLEKRYPALERFGSYDLAAVSDTSLKTDLDDLRAHVARAEKELAEQQPATEQPTSAQEFTDLFSDENPDAQ